MKVSRYIVDVLKIFQHRHKFNSLISNPVDSIALPKLYPASPLRLIHVNTNYSHY